VPRGRPAGSPEKKEIQVYDHPEATRKNNPPVGLVTPETDPPETTKTYGYDPHLDPHLIWAGKAERQSFVLTNVSLHVHERIDPRTIIEAVRTRNGRTVQLSLFESLMENPPLRQAIEFYKHEKGWSNRLIAGDSLLVMNSLLQKEGMAGQVQMVYIDPPYGVKYGSNFQPFVNKRRAKDGSDDDLTQEPEVVQAFRDTWELGLHSYLSYIRDRSTLAKELLAESGSVFIQIGEENVHLVRCILDEVFGRANFLSQISFFKTGSQTARGLAANCDFLLWYAKKKELVKFRRLYLEDGGWAARSADIWVELSNGSRKRRKDLTSELPEGAKLFTHRSLESTTGSEASRFPFTFEGRAFQPRRGWSTNLEGMNRLADARRIIRIGEGIRFVVYLDDFPYSNLTAVWSDTGTGSFLEENIYVVQTATKVVQRCLLMCTDPGDLVLDPTCGSGTTAYCAEKWGRRWITCDTSRVALALAKQRLLTPVFDYYALAHPDEGIASGLRYSVVPHRTLKSIAAGDAPVKEVVYDNPEVDKSKLRVAGPFTVEAVPAPVVLSPALVEAPASKSDLGLTRDGPTRAQADWRAELLKTGIRGKGGQKMDFSRVEVLGGTRWLHADAETKEKTPQRVVVSFGSDYAPLEQRQVELAWNEARTLDPRPAVIIFAAFQFDPEAAKDIDGLTKEKTGMTFLKVQMNTDLFTEDLKKKRSSNESFWLIGQPDVELRPVHSPEHLGKVEVEVRGFDYYNTKTGAIESGGPDKIAMWMLDTDYDGRSLFPRQVFFPMTGEGGGWTRLARALKAEVDEDLIAAYHGTKSLPFAPGKHKRVAVLIVDDRGIESLKLLDVA
jgi:adenine-specific DNA-methyltransferase